MHRPFYSLAVLLQAIALSLILVGSASSEPWHPWLESAERHAETNRELARREWRDFYQSLISDIRAARGNADRVESSSIPWSSAADRTVSEPQFVPTGYDADYDFAMLDGRYHDIAPSSVDIENSMAAVEIERPTIEVHAISCPATSYYFDDWECCLDAGFSSPVYVPSRSGGVSRGDVSWCGEAEGWVEAFASCEDEPAVATIEVDAWQSMQIVVEGTREVMKSALQAYLSPVTEQSLERWMQLASAESVAKARTVQARETLRHLGDAGRVATDASFEILKSSWIALTDITLTSDQDSSEWTDFAEYPVHHIESRSVTPDLDGEKEVLIQAATSLDHMSLVLQQAAQELRYLAADRIVSNPGPDRR